MATHRLHLKNQEEALTLFGQNDQYLRELERRYHVQFFLRPSMLPSGEGLTLAMRGRAPDIEKVVVALETRRMSPNQPGSARDLVDSAGAEKKDVIIKSVTGSNIVARTENQKEYIHAMSDHDLVIGMGPAGTGKTFLAVAFAMAELQAGRFQKIVLTRPVVEAGEKLGFLPGDFLRKGSPLSAPAL
jgi:phosphate starvation-inducible PhoH-like protein